MVSEYDASHIIIILIEILGKRLNLTLKMQDTGYFRKCNKCVKVKEASTDLAAAFTIVPANSGFICPSNIVVFIAKLVLPTAK
ncbi:MAG: hypothetical protein LBQ13_01485 [Endomicrobium sp.]|jgi:DNA repair protein RadA/Sms|nr:hypothetical protein [Endomicrobium sp.]